MTQKIIIKRYNTATIPSSLLYGEVAYTEVNKTFWIGDANDMPYKMAGDDKMDIITGATANNFVYVDANGQVIDSGLALDTDVNLAADSDTAIPSQKAVKGYVDVVAGGSMNLVAAPTDGNILTTDATGQAVDSGLAVETTLTNNTGAIPRSDAVFSAINDAVVGTFKNQGGYDASTNLFPSTGGSGTAGAILNGDVWFITGVGTLGTQKVQSGDALRALVDNPGQVETNWVIGQVNIDGAVTNTTDTSVVGNIVQYSGTNGKEVEDSGLAVTTATDLAGIATPDANKLVNESLLKNVADVKVGTTLTEANILVGNASNIVTGVPLAGDATIVANGTLTIGANKVDNTKLAQMPTATIKGNNTGGTADANDLTVTETNVLLGSLPDIRAITSTATAGATTALTSTSTGTHIFTGTLAQTVTLPVATTLENGTIFKFLNKSTGLVSVTDSASGALIDVYTGTERVIALTSNATAAGTWEYADTIDGGVF